MTYNLHPILVHFPIALLFLYSVIKIFPLAKWFPAVPRKQIERILLFVGFLGALAALFTGPIAAKLVVPNEALVKAHSTFAFFATLIYALLVLGEIISYFKFRENFLSQGWFSKILALAGLVAITVTGMLGGVMVYGLSADPFAGMVLKILGITL
jgi:uncharacterized membrane protein